MEHPGLPPKWVGGRRLCCSAMYIMSSAMQDERILAIVFSKVMSLYALGRL